MLQMNDTVRRRAENKVICCLESLATAHSPPSITLTIILTAIFLILLIIALITCVRRRKEADQVRYIMCYGGFVMAGVPHRVEGKYQLIGLCRSLTLTP